MTIGARNVWQSLAGKYALLVGLLLLTAGSALGVTSYLAFEQSLRDRYVSSAGQLTRLLGEFTAKYLYELRIGELRLVFREIQARDDVLYAFAVDGSGTLLADGSELDNRLLAEVGDPLIDSVRASGIEMVEIGSDSVDMAMPVRLGSEEIGVIRLGLSLRAAN